MVVEDQGLVAMDLMDQIGDMAGNPVGPFNSIASSLAALDDITPDAAILDMRLLDGDSFPVGERLQAMNVPTVVISGHVAGKALRERLPKAHFITKPASPRDLSRALGAALGG